MKYKDLERKLKRVRTFNLEGKLTDFVILSEKVCPATGARIVQSQELAIFEKNLNQGEADIDLDKADTDGLTIRDKYPEEMLKDWGLIT